MKSSLMLKAFWVASFLMEGLVCFGQQRINNLIFNSTENIVGLNFSATQNPDLFYTGIKANATIGEGIAHAENEQGEILFWVNSSGVYDKDNLLMPGSEGIFAHPSSTEIIVCPLPGSPDKYYIFYNNQLCSQLYYSLVDLSLRNKKGDVTALNVAVEAGKNFAEGLEVIRIPCSNDYWLVAFECETGFGRFRISADGVGDYQLFYPFPLRSYTGRGEMDYHKGILGIAFTFINEVFLLNFDPQTGEGSKRGGYILRNTNGIYGLEFSPSGTKLFVTDLNNRDIFGNPKGSNLFSFDLSTHETKDWAIANSNLQCTAQMEGLGHIEQGKDGNLYISQINGCQIVVIENPDADDPDISTINVSSVLSAGISDHIQSDFLEEDLISNPLIKAEGSRSLCANEQLTLYLEDYRPDQSLQWFKNDLIIPGEQVERLVVREAGSYYLQISNNMGCSDLSNEILIEDASLKEIELNDYYESCNGVALALQYPAEGVEISWSNGMKGSNVLISESGHYEVVVSNENCAKAKTFEVEIYQNEKLNIPNVFTPNGDSYNEAFEIRNKKNPIRLFIYNRWGALLYFSEDYQNDWKGEDLTKGTYFYKIEPHNNCGEPQMGWVLKL